MCTWKNDEKFQGLIWSYVSSSNKIVARVIKASDWEVKVERVKDDESSFIVFGVYTDLESAKKAVEIYCIKLAKCSKMAATVYGGIWNKFLEWEHQAASKGSGLTKDQMTGACIFLTWYLEKYDGYVVDPNLVEEKSVTNVP